MGSRGVATGSQGVNPVGWTEIENIDNNLALQVRISSGSKKGPNHLKSVFPCCLKE